MENATHPIVAAAVVALLACSAFGQQEVAWNNQFGGVWSLASNWSPNDIVPNNSGKNLFNVTLNLPLQPYQVNLDIDVTLQNFSLIWSDATLNLGSSAFKINENMIVVRGKIIRLTESQDGGFDVGGELRLQGATLMNAGTVNSNGTLVLDGNGEIDICNTGVDHRGADGIQWTGGGGLRLDQGGSLTNGELSTFDIDADISKVMAGDGTGTLDNEGIILHGGGSRGLPGVTTLMNVNFINTGSVVVNTGGLNLNTLNNLAPENTLAQGAWVVRNDSVLRFGQSTPLIRTLAADVTLVGNHARFINAAGQNAVEKVNRISTTGKLKLREGRTLSVLNDLVVENLLSVEGAPPQGMPDPGRVVLPDGTAEVSGSVIFTESSTLELIFNGSAPDFYGQVIARDAIAEPGSTLRLIVNPDVILSVGDTFELVQARTLTGQFTNLEGLDLGSGRSFEVIQDDGGITAFISPADCAVDLVLDGVLNFFDVSAFIAFFQEGNPVADFNADGNFDFFDVSAFVVAFGRGCPQP
jgi:hypothetical protein